MGQLFKISRPLIGLLLWALAVQSAHSESATYPPADEPWDGASYRALVERVSDKGLPLPTLTDAATKPVFERMTNVDNIPLRMGLNRSLAVTMRFQRLDSALDAIHKLTVLYLRETEKGKPYAQELARLMIYESKVYAALLDVSEPYLATLANEPRYQVHVDYHDQMQINARQFYSRLVTGATETKRFANADILKLVESALAALPAYHRIITDQDRQELIEKLAKPISAATDQKLKTALVELRDSIQHRRLRT